MEYHFRMTPGHYTQTDRQTDTHTHTHTHTQAHTHTHTFSGIHANTHTHTHTQRVCTSNQPSQTGFLRLLISTVKPLVFIVCDSL